MRHLALAAALLTLTGCQRGLPLMQQAPGAIAAMAVSQPAAEIGRQVKALPKADGTRALTFLTYKALDNSLSDMAPVHLNILEKAGSNASVNVLALVDRNQAGDTREYLVQHDTDTRTVTSPFVRVGKAGEQDTGSPAALASAVAGAAKQYPARFRWVDLNSHGGGYQGICLDDAANTRIEVPQLPGALGVAGKLDLLSFDACLMASVEVAYELRDTAKVMVASEDESFALGMNYDKTLAGPPPGDPFALGRDLVINASRFGADPTTATGFEPTADNTGQVASLATISAIDLSRMERVRQAVDGLARALLADLPRQRNTILLALNAVKPFSVSHPVNGNFDHRDLHEVLVQLLQRVDDPAVQAACQDVQATLFNSGGAIILSRAVHAEQKVPRGLSIYLPIAKKLDPRYAATAFAKQTRWDELLAALAT